MNEPSRIFEVRLRAYHHMIGHMATFALLQYPDARNARRASLWWEAYGPRTPLHA